MLKIGFVLSSDTHLQIATELATAARGMKGVECVAAISLRPLLGLPEYPAEALGRLGPVCCRLGEGSPTFLEKNRRRLSHWGVRLGIDRSGHQKREWAAQFSGVNRLPPLDVVFTMNDRSEGEQWCIRRLQARGVKVSLVQESLRRDLSMDLGPGELAHGQGGCDRVYAWGETSVAYFAAAGVAPDRVACSGSPRVDRFVRDYDKLPEPGPLRERLGLPASRPVLLLATNPIYGMLLAKPLPPAEYIRQIMQLAEWTGNLGITLLIKPHFLEVPMHREWKLPGRLAEFPHCFYRTDVSLDEAIRVASAVLVQNSTVAVEAALVGKASGMLFPDSYEHGVDFLERGVCVPVDEEAGLARLMESADGKASLAAATAYVVRTKGTAEWILNDAQTALPAMKASR